MINFQTRIVINKPYYTSGDVLEGTVILKVAKPMILQDLILDIQGTEALAKSFACLLSDTIIILNHSILLFDGQKSFSVGSYHFPFQFQIPSHLPGTFESKKKRSYIKYYLKASTHSKEASKSLKYSREFVLVELSSGTAGFYSRTYMDVSKFLCCGSNKFAEVILKVDKNLYSPGDRLNVSISVNNIEGKAKFKGFKLSLQKHWYRQGTNSINLSSKPEWQTKIREKILPGKNFEMNCSFIIPKDLQLPCESNLHRLWYTVRVELDLPWATNPIADISLEIRLPPAPPSINMFDEHYNKSDDKDMMLYNGIDPIVFEKLTTNSLVAYPNGIKVVYEGSSAAICLLYSVMLTLEIMLRASFQ